MPPSPQTLSLLLLVSLPGCAREPGRKASAELTSAVDVATTSAPARPVARLGQLAPADQLTFLTPEAHLVRIALALRGARPTATELAAVRADPGALGGIVDGYLDGPEFGAVVRDMWNEVLLLRVDVKRFMLPPLGPLKDRGGEAEYLNAIPEEPLRLIEYVAANDRSFGEIVTADYAIAGELAIAAWGATPMAPDPGAKLPTGWQKVAWDSGQPMAGILSSGALWMRHPSNGTNNHRGQAELISEALLCSGFLGRDVPLFNNIDLSDEDAVKTALTTNESCVSCHQTLDPLASHLFGFVRVAPSAIRKAYAGGDERCDKGQCYPLAEYRPQAARSYRKKTGREPNFFGLASTDLRTLAEQIAADPRFSMCSARRFYGYFMQVDLDDIPDATATALQDAFIAGELRVKPLVKAIVMSDDFRAVGAREGSPAAALVGRKTTRPEQLERLIADLTGFTWRAAPGKPGQVGEVSLMQTDRYGYRAMAGGVEGYQITEPSFAYSPTRMLVLQTLAAEAAAHAVEHDFTAPPKQRRLLSIAEEDTAEPAVRAQIAALYERVLAERVRPDGPEVDAAHALFVDGLTGGPRRAWTLLLTALLQDPQIAFH
jgi:hypothetical protein